MKGWKKVFQACNKIHIILKGIRRDKKGTSLQSRYQLIKNIVQY